MRQLFWRSRREWNRGPWKLLVAVTFAALVGVAAGRTVLSFSGSVAVVAGNSMAPSYRAGARVITVPLTAPLERGDVVLLDDGGDNFALKRIIGLPGDTVQLWRGFVFINRRMLHEPYLPKHTYTFPVNETELFSVKLGQGQYFVLGDNRPLSLDSRAYGPVQIDQIKSRVPTTAGVARAEFLAYTLPDAGKRAIRPL